jgi:hypothetical protein
MGAQVSTEGYRLGAAIGEISKDPFLTAPTPMNLVFLSLQICKNLPIFFAHLTKKILQFAKK